MSTLYPIKDHHDNATLCTCDNCGAITTIDKVNPIKDPGERLHAGETIPAGECPECGSLTYINKG